MNVLNEAEIGEATGLGPSENTDAQVVGVKSFPVMEVFGPTIQGEGPAVDEQTIFVRFGGCDYRCKKCDSMHAVLPTLIKENAEYVAADILFERLLYLRESTFCSSITLSGGNPLIHDMTNLITSLRLAHFKLHVETQGTVWRPWVNLINQVVISPKTPGMGEKLELSKLLAFIGLCDPSLPIAIKIVVFSMQDIDYAAGIFQEVDAAFGRNRFEHFLSLGNSMPPSEEGGPKHSPLSHEVLIRDYRALMEDILQDKRLRNVRVLPQTHVLLWGNSRGV